MKLANRFCSCVKSVRKTVKVRRGASSRNAASSRNGASSKNGASSTYGKEQAAIAICVKSVLQSKGRTLKKFKCRKTGKKGPMLKTQALINE